MKSVYVYRNGVEHIEVSFELDSEETDSDKRDSLAFDKLGVILNRSSIDDYTMDFYLDNVCEVSEVDNEA